MSSNSSPGHPTPPHPRTNDLGSGNLEDSSTIEPEKMEDTRMDSPNNGGSETMDQPEVGQLNPIQPKKEEEEGEDGVQNFSGDEIGPTLGDWEFSISNIDNTGVMPEQESDLAPPPGQGQPRIQLQATIKLPSREFCLTRALPDLNLVMELEGEGVQVIKIDLTGTLTAHQRPHDPITQRSFPCGQCGTVLIGKQSLANHMNLVHRGQKAFQCPECNRKFVAKRSMTRHIENIHFRIRHPCPKPNCGKTFADQSALRYHRKAAHH